jgi:hypothetical protein
MLGPCFVEFNRFFDELFETERSVPSAPSAGNAVFQRIDKGLAKEGTLWPAYRTQIGPGVSNPK